MYLEQCIHFKGIFYIYTQKCLSISLYFCSVIKTLLIADQYKIFTAEILGLFSYKQIFLSHYHFT